MDELRAQGVGNISFMREEQFSDWFLGRDHFDLDYTRQEDVRTVVETMMTARRTHRNQMHAYFNKFPSKEAALLKPHPDTTEEQWKELCDLFTSEAFMERMDAFQHQCDLERKTYTEIEVYSEILGKKSGYVRGLGRVVKPPPSSTLTTQSSDLQHQLAKARDEKLLEKKTCKNLRRSKLRWRPR
ncbi:hypothetical protein CJ030_MR8G006647 [Morella rubra]|uniref:Uncharacterized protein n=1 Tax=Morella rubra TaxID=262757 RepID=A0A6A1USV0_9ROSI|nr:hypothetical protein CJ030_MR8G006647 [Morella rubra]